MGFAHVVPRGRRIGMVRFLAHDEATSDEWLPCDGAILDPEDYPELHAKLAADGYPFGGDVDGAAVPDLRGRAPMGASGTLALGDAGGSESVALTVDEMPSHAHQYLYGEGTPPMGSGQAWVSLDAYGAGSTSTGWAVGGDDEPHDNVQPSLVGRWMIYAGCVAVRGGGVDGPTIGEVRAFGHTEDADGWAACGVDAARADYPWLWAHYAALGYPYGAGDGSTTFGTPPTPGRVLMGDGTGDGLTERTIGDVVGAEEVTLESPHLPAHAHALGREIEVIDGVSSGGAGTGGNIAASGVTGSTGGDDPHNNMAPSLAVEYRVFGGTDPVPDEGLLGGMPELEVAVATFAVGVWLFVGSTLDAPVDGAVIFVHDWSDSDTWTGLYYYDAGLEEDVELDGARIAVVAQSAGARIHVCYLTAAHLVTIRENGGETLRLTIGVTPGTGLYAHLATVSGSGNVAPTVATSAAASTNPIGPSIAVTDDTIAVLSVLGEAVSEDPMTPVSETAVPVTTFEAYGSLSATDDVTAGTYAATWNNPESVTACAAVVLIPRRLVP